MRLPTRFRSASCGRSPRSCSLRVVLAALVAALLSNHAAPAASPSAVKPIACYAKHDTWAETMVASRAAVVAAKETLDGIAAGTAKPFSTGSLAGDGPGKHVSVELGGSRILRLSSKVGAGGGNCHIWGNAVLIADDGTTTPLSSLEPVLVNVGWGELINDKNWQDEPLKIADRQFDHGIWVHGHSDVCYVLDKPYERFEAWVGMDAARPKGEATFRVSFEAPDLAEAAWNQVRGDFPLLSNWFARDLRHRYHLLWFDTERNASYWSRRAVDTALDEAGDSGTALCHVRDELKNAKVAFDDPRWLALYALAVRHRTSFSQLDGLALVELRTMVYDEFADLRKADASPADPRWDELTTRVGQIVGKLPSALPVEIASLEPSIETLSRAMPERFRGDESLLKALRANRPGWMACLQGCTQGDKASLETLSEVCEEIFAFRARLVLSLQGMNEFLDQPAHAELLDEWQRKARVLHHDLSRREYFTEIADEVFRPASLILDEDRDPADVVLRRTAALLADLREKHADARLEELAAELASLRSSCERIDVNATEARLVLFCETCRVRRQIALCNPLLNFDALVFIKRHRSIYGHMCDQYYGITARPGGGLYVLEDPFGPNPQVRDVMADAVVQRGRLKGQKLSGGPNRDWNLRYDGMGNLSGDETEGGSFLSPDLSYDGRKIAFAYVECQGDRTHDHHTDPARGHWAPGRCYHLFKVNVDGTGLEQLTDGTFNDFDPCWMPSGRLAFISERRGGYLRCGRICPTFTVYDMEPDGSDIRCLSYHETNEWHPSVTHEGMILFTRWDYIDRHAMVAHHPWVMTPDGRDPRAVQGNFTDRKTRPDMELDLRAIPGSRRYVATGAPHHGQSFGSLVLLDPRVRDDEQMSPLKRLTPEVGFPESQAGSEVYGEAWPLSEDYHLCVYDPAMQLDDLEPRDRYGIYLVDSFGNKVLIYRDSEIGCHNPIPLRPRPVPPVVPEKRMRVVGDQPAEATVGVVDVYHALRPWPEGTKVAALRIFQVLPLSVGSHAATHNTGLQIPGSYSINVARSILGTVPVEEDGSAYFRVPARKELFFQALDEQGLAITSMRSGTQFQPGEQTMCQGCHEPRHGATPMPEITPLAIRREPSSIRPEVDGSNPFSYPRLVQPVLDKHCVACHREHPKEAPRLDSGLVEHPGGGWMNLPTTYYASYVSLAPDYGFWQYGDRLRTIPGEFGARAAPLYQMLQKGHHDVKLSPEEMHRIALWLDSCSLFYGVYEKEGAEAQLRGEIARPTLE